MLEAVIAFLCLPINPTRNGGMQNGSPVGICTQCIRFHTFGVDFYAQSVLINKISASELGRKLIKVALVVGQRCCTDSQY